MFCLNCGRKREIQRRFCTSCGNMLAEKIVGVIDDLSQDNMNASQKQKN